MLTALPKILSIVKEMMPYGTRIQRQLVHKRCSEETNIPNSPQFRRLVNAAVEVLNGRHVVSRGCHYFQNPKPEIYRSLPKRKRRKIKWTMLKS